jgi:hypothetical protein
LEVREYADGFVEHNSAMVEDFLEFCNPLGTNCGDGATLNQTCYLVPNSGPGNFGTLQEISPNGFPRVLQFSARLMF